MQFETQARSKPKCMNNTLREHRSLATKKCVKSGSPKKNNMNKQSIIDAVHEAIGGTKAQAEKAVDVLLDSVVGALKKGDEVSIAGLGIFSTKTRAARTARNPRTGAAVQVPAMTVPKFRAAKALKDAVK